MHATQWRAFTTLKTLYSVATGASSRMLLKEVHVAKQVEDHVIVRSGPIGSTSLSCFGPLTNLVGPQVGVQTLLVTVLLAVCKLHFTFWSKLQTASNLFMRTALVRASQLPLRALTMALIDYGATGLQVSSICTSPQHESVALPPRICGFEFSEDSSQSPSQSHSSSSSCARSSSIPESPLGRELRNAGLVGVPALPKLKLKVFGKSGPKSDHAASGGLRGFQSTQHLPSLAKQHIRSSSCEAPTGGCTSSPCEPPPFVERSSPIDTPRWVLRASASLPAYRKKFFIIPVYLLVHEQGQRRCVSLIDHAYACGIEHGQVICCASDATQVTLHLHQDHAWPRLLGVFL